MATINAYRKPLPRLVLVAAALVEGDKVEIEEQAATSWPAWQTVHECSAKCVPSSDD